MNQHPMSMEAQVAALAAAFEGHKTYVERSLRELLEAAKERERVSREELTVLSQTVRTVAEWQIGHAASDYHGKLMARVEDAEGHITAIRELHVERRLEANKNHIVGVQTRVEAIERRHATEDDLAKGGARERGKYAAVFGFGVTATGAVIGILSELHII